MKPPPCSACRHPCARPSLFFGLCVGCWFTLRCYDLGVVSRVVSLLVGFRRIQSHASDSVIFKVLSPVPSGRDSVSAWFPPRLGHERKPQRPEGGWR